MEKKRLAAGEKENPQRIFELGFEREEKCEDREKLDSTPDRVSRRNNTNLTQTHGQ